MQAEIWKISVCDSVYDAIHGGFYSVIEVYVPQLDAAINYSTHNGMMVLTENVQNRYEEIKEPMLYQDQPKLVGEVTLSGDELCNIQDVVNARRCLNQKLKSVEAWYKAISASCR